MRMHRRRPVRRILALLLVLMLTGSALAIGVDGTLSTEQLLRLAAQVDLPVLFGEGGDTFEVGGVSYYSIQMPAAVSWLYEDDGATVYPGGSNAAVGALKERLEEDFGLNHFVSHTQMRPEVVDVLDEQLAVLIETLYLFCGVERDVRLDGFSSYLLTNLSALSEGMQADIYTVYKYLLISRGLEGSLNRAGKSEGFYYYAQTDPDWASHPFPNTNSDTEADDTMQDRSCGVMSFSMVAATYLHHEIDPAWLADYVVEHGYRVEAHGVMDNFFVTAAGLYGIPIPTIDYADDADGIDWQAVIHAVADENQLVIVHEYTGTFTSRQHYMVLQDYVELDGVGYFLVADPYQLRSRYSNWDQLRDPGTGNEGVIYATQAVLAATCSAVTLFPADKTEWTLTVRAGGPEDFLSDVMGGGA